MYSMISLPLWIGALDPIVGDMFSVRAGAHLAPYPARV